MLNVSEVTGVWTIPFGIDLGNTFWDMLNETGLCFIPFTLSLMNCWLKARNRGQDDGSSAVMFLKMLEKSWVSMFFCLCVFVIPTGGSSYIPNAYTSDGVTTTFSAINYKAYSCRGDYSTILPSSSTSGNIAPNLPFTKTLDYNLPLFMGVANQMFQGYTQALNAMIPCDPDMNATYLMGNTIAFSANGDSTIEYSAKQFVNQCYLPAMSNLAKSIGNGYYNDGAPLTTDERWFNSSALIAAYSGMVVKSKTDSTTKNYDTLYMPYNEDSWAGTGGGDDFETSSSSSDGEADENKIMTCTSAQTQINSVIAGSGGELDENYSEEMDKAVGTEQAYPDKSGSYTSKTDIYTKYAHQFLMDITGNVSGIFNVNNSANGKLQLQREKDTFGDVVSRTTTLFAQLSNNISNYTISLIGGVIISALIAMIFAASPLIIVLSGYSFKVAGSIVYTLAFLIGTTYVLDLGWYIENIILVLVKSSYSIYIVDSAAVDGDVPLNILSMLPFIQTSVISVMLGVWSLLGGALGVMIIPAFSQALNSVSNSVGENGAKVAAIVVKAIIKAVRAAIAA